jgi:hypothetical protein
MMTAMRFFPIRVTVYLAISAPAELSLRLIRYT